MEKRVSERALIQRINRRIGGYEPKTHTVWGERLHKARGHFAPWGVPRTYYTLDNHSNGLTGAFDDLEEYGRETGALGPHERLAEVQP